jgi:hypothetical protein
MKTVVLALAGSLLLASSPAVAEPVTLTQTIVKDGFGKLRRHCDQQGRCWTEGYRNPLLDSYAMVAPPPWYRPVRLAAKPAAKQKVATKPARAAPREAMARMR